MLVSLQRAVERLWGSYLLDDSMLFFKLFFFNLQIGFSPKNTHLDNPPTLRR